MIRWSYARPRLICLAILVAAVYFGLDPLLRRMMIKTGQHITTAKVEIGDLRTSLLGTEVSLHDVQIADPASPMKNLFEARELKLSLDPNAALRKRFVAKQAQLKGLRFGTARAASGELAEQPNSDGEFAERLREGLRRTGDVAAKCLDQLADMLEKQVEKQLDSLETVQLTRELLRHWPIEYQQMEARAEALSRRAEEIRRRANDTANSKDLLRGLENADGTLTETENLRRDIAEFRAELERLRRRVDADRNAVAVAKQHDLERIRKAMQFPRLNADELSDYFLGPEIGERVLETARWIDWARKHMPHKVEPSKPSRMHGIDVLFAGLAKQPNFLIRSLELEGEGAIGREQFQFTGTAEGITSQPAVYGKPTTLKAEVRGAAVMQIEATLDRTQKVASDHIVVECPGVVQAKRTLGRPDRLAVSISPGLSRISLVLDIVDDRLDGELTMRQEPVQIVPITAPDLGERRLVVDLQQAAEQIRTVKTVVKLAGTMEKPDWSMRSTLGPQIAEAVNRLLEREYETRREQLLAQFQKHVDDENARFDRLVASKQDEIAKRLNLSNEEMQQLTTMLARRFPAVREAADGLQNRLPNDLRDRAKTLEKKLPAKLPLRF